MGNAQWRSVTPGLHLIISLNAKRDIESIDADREIGSTEEEISDAFIESVADIARSEAAGLEVSDEAEDKDSTTTFPYNPDSIRVETKPFNINLVYEMIRDGDINLSPDFQRQFVWTDIGARSRLIESIMLRIPLPVFYMAQDLEGRLHVVDGLQRLTVIKQFMDNKLRLRDLEYLTDEDGKVFRHDDPEKCIDQRYRKRIMQTQIMMNIIDPQTPPDVKFDIFKRINQGGRPLNAQEIRNCMSTSETRGLIGAMSKSDEFITATTNSVGVVRMQDQELVLRYLAFRMSERDLVPRYQGNMERFLDHAVDHLNHQDGIVRQELSESFRQSMANSEYLFGAYAFRKCLPDDLEPGARRRLINNSLFTTWSVVLSNFNNETVMQCGPGELALRVAHQLAADPSYYDAVTSGTNDRRRLAYAFATARRICEEVFL